MKQSFILLLIVGFLLATGCGKSTEHTPEQSPEAALQDLSHLATLRCEFTIVSAMEKSDLGGTDKSLSRLTGSVLISFDLNNAQCKRTKDDLVIVLPEATILSPKLSSKWEYICGHRSFYTLETTYNRYRDEAERDAQKKLCEKAKDPALVKIAKDQASLLIRGFFMENFPEIKHVIVK